MSKTRKTDSKKKPDTSPKKKGTRTSKGGQGISAKELKHFEKVLLNEREREMRQLGLIQGDLDRTQVDSSHDLSAFPTHMADPGTDTTTREKDSILVTAEGDTLYEIDQALRRIYDKTYGNCESCGKMISKKRLDAVPYARFCIACQEKEEKAKTD